jgi:hypothetical protein
MDIIIACEFSGIVRDAFIAKGHNAWSCDLIETEVQGPHLIMDNDMHLKDTLYNRKWDMLIAHPPCTRLCNSGVLRLYIRGKKENGIDTDKWGEMHQAALFFKMIWNSPVRKKGLENPIMHGYATKIIGQQHSQIIQPYNFNEDASKATCLWLSGLPKLNGTGYYQPRIVNGKKRWGNQTDSGQNKLTPSETRGHERSRTYVGIAKAMADQWG